MNKTMEKHWPMMSVVTMLIIIMWMVCGLDKRTLNELREVVLSEVGTIVIISMIIYVSYVIFQYCREEKYSLKRSNEGMRRTYYREKRKWHEENGLRYQVRR